MKNWKIIIFLIESCISLLNILYNHAQIINYIIVQALVLHSKLLHFFFSVFKLDMTDFTDEEGYGKFLDLHECYEKYLNLRGIEVRIFIVLYCSVKLIWKIVLDFEIITLFWNI